jgi:hypothetical protein
MPQDALMKRFFAKNYHFTEEQTEESSLDAITWWPEIEAAESHAMEKRHSPPPDSGGPGRRRLSDTVMSLSGEVIPRSAGVLLGGVD